MLDFFWCENKHWVALEILSFLPDAVGFGLIDIQSKIRAFRLAFLRDILSGEGRHACVTIAKYYLGKYMELNYAQELFSVKVIAEKVSHLPVFYADCLRALSFIKLENKP